MVFGLLATLAALALAHAIYVAVTRRRFPPAGERIATRDGSLHVLRAGHGPVVLFVHGANGCLHDFAGPLLADLARDHTVLALDRPGHGWSPRPRGPLDLAANARAVLAAARAFAGVEPVVLVGHSYGAAVAVRAALDAPQAVRGVVAVAPCALVDGRNVHYTRWPLPPGAAGATLAWLATLPVCLPFASQARRDAWHPAAAPPGWTPSRAFALTPAQVRASAENFRHLPADLDALARDLPRLAPPLVVIAGAADRITPAGTHAQALAARAPGARLEVVPDVGHWLP
ncbi:MAG TPA: alpha/beta hydrolase, partial [Candidatus Eisenbacteria bacterium]|nr:alpha/beta hydrolase [Candidatus Eisenbacteria bacterium]